MEKKLKKLTLREAGLSDKNYYLSLTPNERVNVLLELRARYIESLEDESAKRLQRVYRIVKF